MSFRDGVIASIDLEYLLSFDNNNNTTTSQLSETHAPTQQQQQDSSRLYTIDIRIDQPIATNALPSWMRILTKLDTRSRLQGICSVPSSSSSSSLDESNLSNVTSSRVVGTWIQQRILSVDTNQQLLVGLSDSGFPITSLDINGQFSIIWPHQISCRLLRGSSTTATTTTTGRYGYDAVEVYISELLGRVWKMVLYRDQSTGSFNFK